MRSKVISRWTLLVQVACLHGEVDKLFEVKEIQNKSKDAGLSTCFSYLPDLSRVVSDFLVDTGMFFSYFI